MRDRGGLSRRTARRRRAPGRPPRLHGAALLTILACAAVIRGIHLGYDLPELYEEATPMRVAWEMGGWAGTGFDPNPHFFNYPSLVPYLHLAAQETYFATGPFESPAVFHAQFVRNPTTVVLLSRWLSLCFGVAAVAGTYILGRALGGPSAGLLAAAILALSREHVAMSRAIVVDTPLVFFTTLALVASTSVLARGRLGDWVTAGMAVGLAASSKYSGALASVAIVAAHLARCALDREPFARWIFRRELWIAGIMALVAFIVTSPYCLLDWSHFRADFALERRHMAEGHFGRDPAGAASAYAIATWRSFGFFLPFLLLGAWSIARTRLSRLWWAPTAAFMLVTLVVVCTWSTYAPRYIVPVFPCIAAIVAVGMTWLARAAAGRWLRSALAAVVLVPPWVWAANALAEDRRAEALPNTRTLAKGWLEAHAPPGSILVLEQGSATFSGGRTEDGTRFHAVTVPLSVLSPDVSRLFYDGRWYADADYLVSSAYVSDRFAREPARFEAEMAFYRAFRSGWTQVAAFGGWGSRGPRVEIYANPTDRAARGDEPLPRELFSGLAACPEEVVVGFLGSLADAAGSRGAALRALSIYAAETALYPSNEVALADYGALAVSLGRWEEAAHALERATALNPDRAASWNNLGIARLQLGALDSASQAFERAIELQPGNDRARQNLAAVRRMRGDATP